MLVQHLDVVPMHWMVPPRYAQPVLRRLFHQTPLSVCAHPAVGLGVGLSVQHRWQDSEHKGLGKQPQSVPFRRRDVCMGLINSCVLKQVCAQKETLTPSNRTTLCIYVWGVSETVRYRHPVGYMYVCISIEQSNWWKASVCS